MWIHFFSLFVLHIYSIFSKNSQWQWDTKSHTDCDDHTYSSWLLLTGWFTLAVSLSYFCWLLKDSVWRPVTEAGVTAASPGIMCMCVCWWGWTGLKCPSLRLCILLGPGEQYSRHRRTDWEAAALLNDGKPDTLLPPHPLTHTKTHSHFFLLCFFCCCGLNYSSSFVAFRVTNSAAAA